MVTITPLSIRKYLVKRHPEYTERKLNAEIQKQMDAYNKVLTTSPVKEGTITVERSSGRNAKATCKYQTKDGKYHTAESSWTKGYGYDKPSSAVGDIFRIILLPNLMKKRTISSIPYIYNPNDGCNLPLIDVSAAGMEAVDSFVKALGGTWKQVVDTKDVDVYTMNFR